MKLMILDGNSIINRAFYGIRMLNAPDGTPTNAVYGFLSTFRRVFDLAQPQAVCVAFDVHAPTFRHEQYALYKAQRKPMPEELAVQMPLLKQTLDYMGVRRLELAGWEADDLLGTVARRCEAAGWTCDVVTGDKDSLQLITDSTHVFNVKTRMGQTDTIEYTPERFREEYGFDPIRMIDLKALMGDSSDNIPGVPGIGEKTAKDLLVRFGTVADIYRDLDALDIKPGVRKKLTEGRESAQLSFDLATIRTDAPIDFALESAVWDHDYQPELYDWFRRLNFTSLSEKWGLQPADGVSAPSSALPTVDVADSAALRALEQAVTAAPYVAVLAPDGLDTLTLCDGKACYALSWAQLGDDYNAFLRLLFSDRVRKAGHNIKDLMRALLDEGLPTDGFVFDTALAAYDLNPSSSDYTVSKLATNYLGLSVEDADAAACAEALWHLRPVLAGELEKNGMERLYREIEFPLCRVLYRMENRGICIDREQLRQFGDMLSRRISDCETLIFSYSGGEFNINSTRQLGELLFEKLGLPPVKKTKTGYSTNAEVLEKLKNKHPIVPAIMDYRMLTKLKSTYADGLMKEIREDGRIHTTFQNLVTATGRLSSTEPNLQNIPVRTDLGAEIRKMFIPKPGCVLVDADYSQIELRVLAHIAGDDAMRKAFCDHVDIHTATAAQVFGVPVEEVTPLQRRHAKAVNFGIVYGISEFSLAEDIGVSRYEARAYIDNYLNNYRGVKEYMHKVVADAREIGYTETLYGRRRYIPELKSSNFNVRSGAERIALNTPIQGTAADLIKLAMIRVENALNEKYPDAKLLLQVHDELIVECPEGIAQEVAALVSREMENVASLSVPLTAEAKFGKSWYEAK